jgi:hypothetical protein
MKKQMIAFVAMGVTCASIGIVSGQGRPSGGGVSSGSSATSRSASSDPFGEVGASIVPGVPSDRYLANPRNAGPNPANAVRTEISKLTQQLRQADDDAKKAELVKQLETAVAKYFDEDLKNREGQLTKLEERVTKLRAQLERRRKAKAEITQLQTKVLANDADGLGFSGGPLLEGGHPVEFPTPTFRPNPVIQEGQPTQVIPQLSIPQPTPGIR